ncbi:MAG: hypothetical protein AB1349_10680 [Elusimicrobiota bacterium]
MEKSKWGGDKNGIGLYEIMTAPQEIVSQVIDAIKNNEPKLAYELLDLNPGGIKNDLHD